MKKIYLFLVSLCFLASAQSQLVIFADDYGTGVSFAPFGGSNNSLTIDDTEARPGSPGTKSLRIGVPAGGYTGGAMVASEPRNATAFNAISFWVKSSKNATLNVTGLGNNAGAPSSFETERTNISISTTWQRVILPVPDPSKLTSFNGLWHFAEGADEGAYSIWFDDIQYENVVGVAVPSVATMSSQNLNIAIGATFTGSSVTATIPVDGTPVALAPVGPGFLTYTSEPAGRITFNATGVGTAQEAGAATVTATLRGTVVNGTINVTVLAGPTGPNVAPATPPARNPEDVVSIFSDAYALSATMNVAPWSANQAAVVVAAANNVLEIQTGGAFAGFQLSSAVNLTNMTFMHFDLWISGTSQVGAVFNPKVSQHSGGHLTGETVAYEVNNPMAQGQEGRWLSFDFPFSGFSNGMSAGVKNIISEIIFTYPFLSAGGPLYMDNIYFYNTNPLPVKWASFTAVEKANTVVLNWETATEVNNTGFVVERSKEGRAWSELTFVNATAANGTGASYTSVDFAPLQGTNYYRLRQIDRDGRFSFSDVKLINFNGTANVVSVFPNPAKQQLQIVANGFTEKGSYIITDMMGKQVQSGVFPQLQAPMQIGLNKLSSGIYSITLRDGKKTETVRFVVQ